MLKDRWYGTLTQDNSAKVAEIFESLLKGQRFSIVVCDQSKGFEPQVKSGHRLIDVEVRSLGSGNIRLNVRTTNKDFTFYSNATNESERDETAKNAYVESFLNFIKVSQREPSGNLVYVVFVISWDMPVKPLPKESFQVSAVTRWPESR